MHRLETKIAEKITTAAGSMKFVYVHGLWFGFWILGGIGVLGHSLQFDPAPFGMLTMIVSLESIFLSTFVMVSQNRQAEKADQRAEEDFRINTKAEQEIEDMQHDLDEIKQLLRSK
jgi:uncharacterized membrane protein